MGVALRPLQHLAAIIVADLDVFYAERAWLPIGNVSASALGPGHDAQIVRCILFAQIPLIRDDQRHNGA